MVKSTFTTGHLLIDEEADGEDDVTDGHPEHRDDEHQLPVEPRDDDQRDDRRHEQRHGDDDRRHVGIDRCC